MNYWEKLTSKHSLKDAWMKIRKNTNSSGIDRISPDKFETNLDENLNKISDELKYGGYKVLPVIKLKPKYLTNKERPLVIPTVKDKIVMRALADILTPIFEKEFCECSYSYRPHRSAYHATENAEQYIHNKYRYFFRADIEKFFECINHEILLSKIKHHISEPKVITLLAKLLKSKVLDGNDLVEPVEGLHQGSPISPLLSNIFLDSFDKAITKYGLQVIRYCDDILIMAKTEDEINEAEFLVKMELKKLHLKLKPEKNQKGDLRKGFIFLGYHFNQNGRIASKKSVDALNFKLKQIIQKHEDNSEKIDSVIHGWENYFGHINEIPLGSLESILAFLKSGRYSDPDTLIRERNKIKETSTAIIHIALAAEWEQIGQENLCTREVLEAFKCIQSPSEFSQLSVVLKITEEVLRELVRVFKRNNFDILSLSEFLAEKSYFYLAKKFHEFQIESETFYIEDNGLENLDPAFFEKYLNLFSGKNKVYSVEHKYKTGKRIFTSIKKQLKPENIQEHINGETTIDLHLFKDQENVRVMVIDIDISKECISDNENYQRNLKNALKDAIKISTAAKSFGIPNIIEYSGYKGYHIWFFFEKPILAAKVREFAFSLLENTGDSPSGINREIFPVKNSLKENEESCVIKLPLGFHSKTESRCLFIDEKGNIYPNQAEAVKKIEPVKTEILEEVIKILKIEKNMNLPNIPTKSHYLSNFPKTQELIKGCNVINHIVNKAEETGYLNHKERVLLLSSLGHVENEGKEVIHAVIKNCFNYEKAVTTKYINKMYDKPIGCRKIQENYQEITCKVDCNCFFKKIPSETYPSPLLHINTKTFPKGIRVSEYKDSSPKVIKEVSSKLETSQNTDWFKDKSQQINTFVSDQINLTKEEPNNSQVKEIEIKIKSVHDKKKPKIEIFENIKKLANFKKQLKGIEKAITKCEEELNLLFDELGTNEIEVETGILLREEINGKTKWRIEI